jgi:PBP1b-binding outer membrane lipoprotein LpoB
MKRMLILAVLVILIGGCAGKVEYLQPTQTYKAINSVTINKSKTDVWKQIIPSLSSSFFVINNLDKESGLINVSYSGNPEKYVDCGVIDSYVKNARGERRYNFPASSAYKEYETMQNGQNLLFYKRKMNLEGRINIVVQEVSVNSTLVTVNIKYILTKDIFVSNPQNQSQHINDNISFNTNGSASFPQQTTCYATGVLEQEVLNLIGI